ncbi:hypothetical protein [Mycoplasmopsis gallinacea]|uniref:Uncharacterized protein n=1 Tax=Mycoplasmopsis gallinacea TaxID=29556 RepID=A0A6H0V2U9_9BACT|nr:hypothetical protein [Mycoplasmopsis gallinacea]QIW62522.1 hypothetical protein GOQ20_03830 [Mycoplasmopsis gallinacea]
MLLIETNPILLPIKKQQDTAKGQNSFWNFLKKAVSFLIDVVIEIAADSIAILTGTGAAGRFLIKGAAHFIKNIATSLVQTGQVNWKTVLMSTAMDALLFARFNVSQLAKKGQGIIGKLSKGIMKGIEKGKQVKKLYNFLKKGVADKIEDIAKELAGKKFIQNSRFLSFIFNKKLVDNSFKYGKMAFEAIKDPLSLIVKGQAFLMRKTKEKAQKMFQKVQYAYFNKLINLQVKKGKLNQQTKKYWLRAMNQENKGQLFFNSKWLSGVRVYNQDYWDQTGGDIAFMLYFKTDATGGKTIPGKKRPLRPGKRPLELSLPLQTFLNFIKAESPGRFYLDNIAWGWIKGKGVRNLKDGLYFEDLESLKLSKDFERFRLEYEAFDREALTEELALNTKYTKAHRTNKTQFNLGVFKTQDNKYVVKPVYGVDTFQNSIFTSKRVKKLKPKN